MGKGRVGIMADHNGARGISRCERPDATESMTISRKEMHFAKG